MHQRVALLHCDVDFAVGTVGESSAIIVAACPGHLIESAGCLFLRGSWTQLSPDRLGAATPSNSDATAE